MLGRLDTGKMLEPWMRRWLDGWTDGQMDDWMGGWVGACIEDGQDNYGGIDG